MNFSAAPHAGAALAPRRPGGRGFADPLPRIQKNRQSQRMHPTVETSYMRDAAAGRARDSRGTFLLNKER
jgi:hypothetical protein